MLSSLQDPHFGAIYKKSLTLENVEKKIVQFFVLIC